MSKNEMTIDRVMVWLSEVSFAARESGDDAKADAIDDASVALSAAFDEPEETEIVETAHPPDGTDEWLGIGMPDGWSEGHLTGCLTR